MTTCQYKCAPNRRHLLFSFKWIGHFSCSLNFSITFRTHTTPISLSTVYYNIICWDSLGEKTHFFLISYIYQTFFSIFRRLRFKTNYSTTWNYCRFFWTSLHPTFVYCISQIKCVQCIRTKRITRIWQICLTLYVYIWHRKLFKSAQNCHSLLFQCIFKKFLSSKHKNRLKFEKKSKALANCVRFIPFCVRIWKTLTW